MKYDMHIATEAGDSTALRQGLAALGFRDDNLVRQQLMFDPETAKHYVSCPLIDVHASKKIETHPELRELEIDVDRLMKKTGATGYWHSECILADEHIESNYAFSLKPLPFSCLLSRPRAEEKVWDIHLAFKESIMPEGLGSLLIENGIYYLARMKKIAEGGEAKFAIYNVQGVTQLTKGRRFYTELCNWLKEVGVPPCDIKLELTTAMKLYNSPQAVPPTIDSVTWI